MYQLPAHKRCPVKRQAPSLQIDTVRWQDVNNNTSLQKVRKFHRCQSFLCAYPASWLPKFNKVIIIYYVWAGSCCASNQSHFNWHVYLLFTDLPLHVLRYLIFTFNKKRTCTSTLSIDVVVSKNQSTIQISNFKTTYTSI